MGLEQFTPEVIMSVTIQGYTYADWKLSALYLPDKKCYAMPSLEGYKDEIWDNPHWLYYDLYNMLKSIEKGNLYFSNPELAEIVHYFNKNENEALEVLTMLDKSKELMWHKIKL